MILATAWMTFKDVKYINGQWEWYCSRGTFKKHSKSASYIYSTKNRHLTSFLDFKFYYSSTCYTILQYRHIYFFMHILISLNVLCLEYFYVLYLMFHYCIVI